MIGGESRLSRRSVLMAPAGALVLAACASAGQSTAGPSGAALSQEAATVTFLGRGSVTSQQSFEELTRRFTQELAPKVTVQYTHADAMPDEKYQVLAAGGSTPDIFFGTVANYKVHIARGIAGYLDELAKRDKQFKEAD